VRNTCNSEGAHKTLSSHLMFLSTP